MFLVLKMCMVGYGILFSFESVRWKCAIKTANLSEYWYQSAIRRLRFTELLIEMGRQWNQWSPREGGLRAIWHQVAVTSPWLLPAVVKQWGVKYGEPSPSQASFTVLGEFLIFPLPADVLSNGCEKLRVKSAEWGALAVIVRVRYANARRKHLYEAPTANNWGALLKGLWVN